MPNLLTNLSISGGIGFLSGLALVSWVEPTTKDGRILLMVISVVTCTIIGGIISRLVKIMFWFLEKKK